MDSEQLEFILDHYKNPRNQGKLEEPDATFEEGIPSCGDVIRLDLKIRDDVIEDVKFSGNGCAISQASVSILTENIVNKRTEEILSLTEKDMFTALGGRVSPIRYKCALLGFNVLKKALIKRKAA